MTATVPSSCSMVSGYPQFLNRALDMYLSAPISEMPFNHR
jgi:hypothetical protein